MTWSSRFVSGLREAWTSGRRNGAGLATSIASMGDGGVSDGADSSSPSAPARSPSTAATECEWCGSAHPREALCQARPKWSRRGFLALLGTGVAGLAIAGKLPAADEDAYVAFYEMRAEYLCATPGSLATIDGILKTYYEPFIAEQLNKQRPLAELMGERGRWTVPEGGAILRRVE